MISDDLTRIPALAPGVLVATVDERTLLFQSPKRRAFLHGLDVCALVEAIDGRRSLEEIIARVRERVAMPVAIYLTDKLEAAGYIEAAEHPSAPASFCSDEASVQLPAAAPQRSARAVARHAVLDALAEVGVTVDGGIELFVCDDYLDPELLAALSDIDGPVLLVQANSQTLIGPVLAADETAPCLHCLQHALRWNRPVERFIETHGLAYRRTSAPATHARLRALASALGAVTAQLRSEPGALNGKLLELTDARPATEHRIRRRPQCSCCGDPELVARRGRRVFQLAQVPITFADDGGLRCRKPAETLAEYEALVSPLTGVVNYLHPMPGRHSESRQVYVAGYQVCPADVTAPNGFDKICAGKGKAREQAMASALCEALERASSVWQGDEAHVIARQAELDGRALSFQELQGFSEQQFRERARINAQSSDPRRWVPLPCDAQRELAWTPAWSLTRQERCWIPTAYCFAETPAAFGTTFGIYNPNGTAAGNCAEEALLQGLFELVERDATAIWWYNQVQRPALDLTHFADEFIQRLQAEYEARGWTVNVLDITHDLGLGVYAAVAHHAATDRFALGFGCHGVPYLAVTRALTELNQLLDERSSAPHPWDRTALPAPSFLRPVCKTQAIHESTTGNDLRACVQTAVAALAERGLEVVVVDKTRPDIGLNVLQVIVPSLRHFWPRFGPGRLYEVPVTLGWLKRSTPEAQLNPAPLFL